VHPPLDVELAWQGRTAVIALGGAIDLYGAPLLAERIEEVEAAGAAALEVDLSALRFIDSSGLRILLDAHRTFGGNVSLQGASGLVLRVLEAAATAPALNAEDRRLARAFAPTEMLSS
jgi:anti-sigma B factor antagonist